MNSIIRRTSNINKYVSKVFGRRTTGNFVLPCLFFVHLFTCSRYIDIALRFLKNIAKAVEIRFNGCYYLFVWWKSFPIFWDMRSARSHMELNLVNRVDFPNIFTLIHWFSGRFFELCVLILFFCKLGLFSRVYRSSWS